MVFYYLWILFHDLKKKRIYEVFIIKGAFEYDRDESHL